MLTRLLLVGIVSVSLLPPTLLENATTQSTGKDASSANHLRQQHYSSFYIVQITLGVDQTTTLDLAEISTRLSDVVSDALEKRATTHLQQDVPVFSSKENANSQQISVKVTNEERSQRENTISFVVFTKQKIVPAEVIINDLVLLSFSHISARLRYPVIALQALTSAEEKSQSRWWLIALIVGSGALILLCGWILLVIYFNTCASPPYSREPRKFSPTGWTHKELDEGIPNPPQPRSRPEAVVIGENSPKTKCPEIEYKTICKPMAIEPAENREEIAEAANRDIEKESFSQSEIPITGYEDVIEDAAHETETNEDSHVYEHLSAKRLLRPKSAGPRRPLRTPEGDIIQQIHPTTREWSPYHAGDQVAQIFYIGATLTGHPTPAPPTNEGVLVMRNMSNAEQSEPFNIL